MEQSPIVGYLKVLTFGFLAAILFLAVWQGNKTEEKIVRLDQGYADLNRNVKDLAQNLRDHKESIDTLRGVNQTLLRMIASGGVAVRQETGPVETTPTPAGDVTGGLDFEDRPEWGWELNDHLDAHLNEGKPVGTPGRYKNFLKLDPAGSEAPKDPPNRDGVIQLPWGPEPKGFNFLLENYATLTDECEIYVNDAPARRHWQRPSSFNWKPALCWRIEVSPDYKEYTLFFRRDAKWHLPVGIDVRKYPHLDGDKPVTARDMAFTLGLIMNAQTKLAVSRSYYKDMESWEALDDWTLVVRWKETLFTSLAYTMGATILPEFVYANNEKGEPYPEATVGQEFNEHWFDRLRKGSAGCGPYRFADYQSGKFVRMERWDDWYGFKDQPRFAIQARHLRIYNESETALNWLRSGELDIAGLNAVRYRDWVLEEKDPKSPFKDGRINTYIAPRTAYLYIGWKNSDPMFSDKRVRQALTYACNRKEICEKIFLKRYEPMAAPLYPASEEADPELKPYPFDPAKAEQLLDEAGWTIDEATDLRTKVNEGQSTPFEFKLYWPGPNPEFQSALDHFKNDLLKIGIRMVPQSVQWAQFQKDLNDRKFKAFSLLWALGGWEHDFGQIWHSDGIEDTGSSNYIEFDNPELDELQDKLRTLMDPKERVEAIHRIGRILYEEQPYTFFGWSNSFRAYWTRVHGLEENPYFIRPLWRTFPLWMD